MDVEVLESTMSSTVHSVIWVQTDRQTDRQTERVPPADGDLTRLFVRGEGDGPLLDGGMDLCSAGDARDKGPHSYQGVSPTRHTHTMVAQRQKRNTEVVSRFFVFGFKRKTKKTT
ncbi:hypothetical protein EYF80_032277 [Liparis tanakae]|uniref:Uncharacterized protein n=1 Tax=Liparis tanakae TaxID=230148 RepID=A0A4Z2GXF0_9TELE|nr:hypothetical protein EYF80_032277 [Liparis tanakae]